jgi:hypothetical protein
MRFVMMLAKQRHVTLTVRLLSVVTEHSTLTLPKNVMMRVNLQHVMLIVHSPNVVTVP